MARRHTVQGAPEDAGADAGDHPARDLRQPQDPELKRALRSALDLTQSTPNLIAMSLVQKRHRPVRPLPRRHPAHRRARLRAHRRARRRRLDPRPAQGLRRDAEPSSATSSSRSSPPATRPRRPRSPGRSNGSRATRRTSTRRPPTRSSTRSCAPARCSASPPARRCSPTDSADTRSRRACTSRPASTSRNRRGLGRHPVRRRHTAAAWAPRSPQLEMREVLRAVDAVGSRSDPRRAEGERMRRRSITLAPSSGAEIIADPLA